MYQIKARYQTGDSFGHKDAETVVELKWASLDVAKENLRRIREHYDWYGKAEGSD